MHVCVCMGVCGLGVECSSPLHAFSVFNPWIEMWWYLTRSGQCLHMSLLFCIHNSIKQHGYAWHSFCQVILQCTPPPPPLASPSVYDHQGTWSAMSRSVSHRWPCQHCVQPLQGLADAGVARLAWDICSVSLRPSGHQYPQPALCSITSPLPPAFLSFFSPYLLLWSPPLPPSSLSLCFLFHFTSLNPVLTC